MSGKEFNISDYLSGSDITSSVVRGAGASFIYGGAKFEDVDFNVQNQSVSEEDGMQKSAVVLQHADTPLKVNIGCIKYRAFDTLQYSMELENTGDKPIDNISEFKSLDIIIDANDVGELVFHSIKGGTTEANYPSEAYKHEVVEIYPDLLDPYGRGFWKDNKITTKGGFSSNLYFPIMFVENRQSTQGMFISVGWSGQWEIKATKYNNEIKYRISGGLCGFDVALNPGEKVAGPNIYIGGYYGDVMCGSNLMRSFTDHIGAAHPNKKTPPISFDQWFGYSTYFDEKLMMELADISAELELEYFIMDAGWFPGCDKVKPISGFGFFSTGVGNWTVDEKKFPNGLKPFAEYVRSKGMEFGLWFEPERVYKETIMHERKEMLLCEDTKPYAMLDLGNPQARQWLKNMLAGYIDELGIKWIRYDCNLTPLVFWDKNDEPDRKGILEIRHIEGLYEVWDWLNETYPDLILEGCASGGRRIDFEAIKRCHLFVSSDQNLNPNLVRNHLHGANRILPGRYHNVLFGPNILVDYPDYYYHSYFGGSLQISDPLTQWDEKIKQTTIKHLKAYKRIRHLINEDVNLPFGDPTDLTKWQGWQHYKNDCSEGVLIAFRLRSEAEYTHVMLKGIDESAEYVIEDLYTGKTQPILGTDLAQGIKIELDTNGSRIVYYKRV